MSYCTDSLGGEDAPHNIVLLCKRCHVDNYGRCQIRPSGKLKEYFIEESKERGNFIFEYLETEDGLKILEEQKAKKQLAQEKLQARLDAYRGVEYAQPTQKAQAGEGIEEKLQKLETLYSKSLITEEEYKVKKQKLIDEL